MAVPERVLGDSVPLTVTSHRSIPGLDGLRAFSILIVVTAHLALGTQNFPYVYPLEKMGNFGVRVFFVLSGFLITSILLAEQERTGTIWLRRFYFRRVLRLFPACWVLVGVVAILASRGYLVLHRHDLFFAATYLANFHWTAGWPLRHLWSLAVEEQFYLLWPLVLRSLRRTGGIWLLLGTIVGAPIFRVVFASVRHHFPAFESLVSEDSFFVVADSLGTGCLLATMRGQLFAFGRYRRLLESRWFFLIPGIAFLANYVILTKVRWVFLETVMNVGIAITVDWVSRNPGGRVGRILNSRLATYVGMLSYSLYLWQQVFLNRLSQSILCAFPWNIMLQLPVAMLTYGLIERPFLWLRAVWEPRMFPEPETRRPDPTTQAAGVRCDAQKLRSS
jgi:peptidoglycan/LPS O-acetylase OafA/YrhL